MANPARNFVNKASDVLTEISDKQRNFKRSQSAYQRLEKARDILAAGRSAILYGGEDMQSEKVQKAQALIERIQSKTLDLAVTFGTV